MAEDKNDSYSEIDKSQFYDLNREIQASIKDKVIAKLLTTVQNQAKEISSLKTENENLKNHLSYILKKIILNKGEYGFVGKSNPLPNETSRIKIRNNANNSAIFKDNRKSKESILRPLRSVEQYRCVTEGNVFDPVSSTKKNRILNNEDYIYDQNNTALDNKVNGYLNNLYRNNFINTNSLSNDYYLNKNESLYDELFKNKKINSNLKYDDNEDNKKDYSQIRTNSYMKPKKRNNRNIREKRINQSAYESAAVRIRNSDVKQKKGVNKNNNQTYGEKIKARRGMLYLKRSPYLVNKY